MGRYAEYKDSEVEWIGEIPVHWEITKVKRKCNIIGSGMTPESNQPEYYDGNINWIQTGDLYHKTNVYGTEKFVSELALKDYSVLSIYYAPFIVIAMYGASIGNVAISKIDACVNQACCVILPSDNIKMMFMFYWIKNCKEDFIKHSLGGGQPNISQNKIKGQVLIVPPLKEQTTIINYLDKYTSKIGELISDLQTQLTMLTRYKRDLIAECVTKGLNKDAPMRPSGEDWIGDVPEHWKIVPLRAFLKSNNKKNLGGLPLLSVERERGVVNRETDGSPDNYNRIPDDLSNYKMVNEGQFVMNKMKAWQGSYGVAPCDGIVSPAYHVYDLVFENKAFFNYAIRSKCYVGFFGRDSYGIRTDQWDFKAECIKHIPFVVPSLEEQKEIVNYLSKQVSRINSLQENITSQIQKLKDYRRILIHDAVTGKIKI